MNITLSIDERLADEARRAAQGMGMSLNQAVRQYLERLAGGAACVQAICAAQHGPPQGMEVRPRRTA
jgi:hypothetical protein